ncbi:hypothetical protein H2201_006381 [Coniosporium apollinis]|uniref:Aspergillus nuclease S(1) n=1 Tax=Coniosporium apollinis TaxID=61459 RepID=A0ABQ9NMA9_9PEZI|nr:hypothetical protein H2201_006381 [Coniosporium apollinis]
MRNYLSVITNSSNAFLTKKEALMFLLHFIGDIHQPLHTENASRGGNDIDVRFGNSNKSLHAVWDTEIVLKHRGLRRNPSNNEEKEAAAKWANELHSAAQARGVVVEGECNDVRNPQACALRWATEANRWICRYVLKNGVEWLEDERNDLALGYYDGAVPVVGELVETAGVRLGVWLNAVAAAHRSHEDFVVQTARENGELVEGQEL